jgi:uncharacterized phage protein (TIGR01671 family)
MVAERKRGMRMQDRYLFKAKRTDNGEWVIGNRIDDGVTGQVFIHAVGNSVNESDKVGEEGCLQFVAFEVAPATICQCTGLKDKNGNLIWENDIVEYRDCTTERYVVAYENDKACFEYQQYGCSIMNFDEMSSVEVEVVGNVFDNPELLEV